jgi:hypothetical protein
VIEPVVFSGVLASMVEPSGLAAGSALVKTCGWEACRRGGEQGFQP